MSKIEDIKARVIIDSRSEKTIELTIFSNDGFSAKASIPEGRSKGIKEVQSLPPNQAMNLIHNEILPKIKGLKVRDQFSLDHYLKDLDGSVDKSNLGGNTLLAISLANARLQAQISQKPLWLYLSQLINLKPTPPRLLANLINGGAHANNNLFFQEYLLIPETINLELAIEEICKIYQKLALVLRSLSLNTAIGDEGGYSSDINGDWQPFELIKQALENENSINFNFGLDAAVSGLSKSPKELLNLYQELIDSQPLIYLEDPADENDFITWEKIFSKWSKELLVVGDDLTATNPSIISQPRMEKMINGIIIKPNQIGTLSETLEAISLAKKNNWQTIISHRSGETNDDFIADLAYGTAAWGFKLGAPARGERTSKYNRLLEIVEEAKKY